MGNRELLKSSFPLPLHKRGELYINFFLVYINFYEIIKIKKMPLMLSRGLSCVYVNLFGKKAYIDCVLNFLTNCMVDL